MSLLPDEKVLAEGQNWQIVEVKQLGANRLRGRGAVKLGADVAVQEVDFEVPLDQDFVTTLQVEGTVAHNKRWLPFHNMYAVALRIFRDLHRNRFVTIDQLVQRYGSHYGLSRNAILRIMDDLIHCDAPIETLVEELEWRLR